MADITMSTEDTLELDTILEESGSSDILNVTDGIKGEDFNLSGIDTHTDIFDPIKSGTYTIDVNGQELTVKVTDPNNLPESGLLHRYDPTEMSSSDGDSFGSVSDLKSGDNLVNGSGGTYLENIKNGNAVLDFSRNEYIETSGGFSSSTPTKWSMYFVAKDSPDSSTFDSLWDNQADSRNHNLYNDNDSPDWELRGGGSDGFRINNADNDWHIWTYSVDGNNSVLKIEDRNDKSEGSKDQALDGLTLGSESGGNDGTPCKYGEILIYDSSNSSFSESSVLSYLSDKWGINI